MSYRIAMFCNHRWSEPFEKKFRGNRSKGIKGAILRVQQCQWCETLREAEEGKHDE